MEQLRNQHHADLVALVVPQADDGICGRSFIIENPGFGLNGFSVIKRACLFAGHGFLHGVGHNLGMRHDRFRHGGGRSSRCNYGYVNIEGSAGKVVSFRTAMATPDRCLDFLDQYCVVIGVYSEPFRFATPFGDEARYGVECSSPDDSANNREILLRNASRVSNFR